MTLRGNNKVISVNGKEEVELAGNQKLNQVLYDMSDSGGSIRLDMRGQSSLTNVGIRGLQVRCSGLDIEPKTGLYIRSSGEVVIDSLYIGDGSVDGRACPLFIDKRSEGRVIIRNSYISGWPNSCIYASEPGREDNGFRLEINNCFCSNSAVSNIRMCNGIIKDSVIVTDDAPPNKEQENADPNNKNRGILVENKSELRLINSILYHPHESNIVPIECENGSKAFVTNCKIGPMDKENWCRGNVILEDCDKQTVDPEVHNTIPSTAEEASNSTRYVRGGEVTGITTDVDLLENPEVPY